MPQLGSALALQSVAREERLVSGTQVSVPVTTLVSGLPANRCGPAEYPRLRLLQECDRLGDFEGVRNYLEYKSPGSSKTGALAMALISSEQELAREHSRRVLTSTTRWSLSQAQ